MELNSLFDTNRLIQNSSISDYVETRYYFTFFEKWSAIFKNRKNAKDVFIVVTLSDIRITTYHHLSLPTYQAKENNRIRHTICA